MSNVEASSTVKATLLRREVRLAAMVVMAI